MDEFVIDERLDADSIPVKELKLCSLRLIRDANYPWFVLIPRRDAVSEIHELADGDQQQLMAETAAVSRALKATTQCHKINVGMLGNIVSQLHVHVVARFEGDAAWPGPVWGACLPTPYNPASCNALIEDFLAALKDG